MGLARSTEDASGNDGPHGDAGRPRGRSSLLLALSLVASSMLGAAQAFALLVICGTDPRTEAFLAAYTVYLPVAVLGASLRATVSGLVARAPQAERAERACDVVSRCILFGALVAGTMLVLAPLLAPTISGDLDEGVRDTTLVALAVLLPAAFLHVVAAALSGALGAHHEFGFSAAAYVVTGSVSLAVSIGMLSAIGPLGAAAGVLAGTVLLATAHVRRGRALGIRVRLIPGALSERAQWQIAAEILSGAALGFSLQASLAISLAALGAHPGAITAYSYAFFLATMILSLSSLPLALVTLPGLVGEFQRHGRSAVADHIARFAPYAYAVVLPLVAGVLGFGRPAVASLFEPFVDEAVARLIVDVGCALVLMTIPATLFYLASAASLPAATPRNRLLAAGVTIGLHAAAVASVGGDPQAIAWAHAAAMSVSTGFLLVQVIGRQALGAALLALRGIAPVVIASVPVLIIGLSLGSTAPVAKIIGAAALAAATYVLVLRRLAPAIVEPFVAVLRRPAATTT